MKLIAILISALAISAPLEARGCVDGERIFADVPFDHPFCQEIESLYRDGMTSGCRVDEDGTRYFCPDAALTRDMAAAFVEHRDPFAQISPRGKFRISDHAAYAERVQRGVYWVQFTRDIQVCSMEAWSHDRHGPAVDVRVGRLFSSVDTVSVETFVFDLPTDMWFNVRLHCQ